MRCDREKNKSSQHLAFDKTGEDACCKRAQIILIYHLCSFVSAPSPAENAPAQRCPACSELKCHLTKFKGLLGFEPLVPYQSTVVFAILVGQVCNGGCNAGTEELLPLVKVTLMDFIEELVVSVNINNGYEFISAGENCTTTNLKAVSLFWINTRTYSGIFAARCSICSINDWKQTKLMCYFCSLHNVRI